MAGTVPEGGEPDKGGGDGAPVSSDTPPLLRPLRAFDPSMFMDDGDDTLGLLAAATFVSALGDYVGCGEPGGAHAAQATLLMKHLRGLALTLTLTLTLTQAWLLRPGMRPPRTK